MNRELIEARFYFDHARKRIVEIPDPGAKHPSVLVYVSGPKTEVIAIIDLLRASVAAISEG